MLQQNWFIDKRYVMFEDTCYLQCFFDLETECIYEVKEDREGRIVITQYEEGQDGYNTLYYMYTSFLSVYYCRNCILKEL